MKNRSPQTTYAICQLCGETIQLNLLQNHLRTVHGLTYIEYKEQLEWQRKQSIAEKEKKTS